MQFSYKQIANQRLISLQSHNIPPYKNIPKFRFQTLLAYIVIFYAMHQLFF